MLTPKFPKRLAAIVLLGGPWCALAVAAVLGQPAKNIAPLPAAAPRLEPITVIVRTVPIIPEPAFGDRWQAPAPAMQQARIAPEAQIEPERPTVAHAKPKPAERHAQRAESDICTRHGMHKVITRGGKSWRCRHEQRAR